MGRLPLPSKNDERNSINSKDKTEMASQKLGRRMRSIWFDVKKAREKPPLTVSSLPLQSHLPLIVVFVAISI
jgi:hypothetical protein